ncbi:MAG: hypothetical protein WCX80_04585 [Patescibacteria group bacterium]
MNNRLIYICHPYRGDGLNDITRNINGAESYARLALEAGYCPITPHSLTPALFGVVCTDEEAIVAYQRSLIKACSKLFVCGKIISNGMQNEIEFCQKEGVPIEYISKNNPIKPHTI